MLSITLNLRDRPVAVVGGGNVAQRKIDALLKSGATVRVIALNVRPTELVAEALDWIRENYQSEHLQGAAIVLAAATPEVNAVVIDDARTLGIPVSSASHPDESDFFLPATIRRGDLLLSISTQGRAPAFSRYLRERLEEVFDEAYEQWVKLLGELRPEILSTVNNDKAQDRIWEILCDPRWVEQLRRLPVGMVLNAMKAEIRTLVDSSPQL